MRFCFMKKKIGDDLSGHEQYRTEEYPGLDAESKGRDKNSIVRIALYGGLFVVFVVAVGGYYYLYLARVSLNKNISKQSPAIMKAINLGGEFADPVSKEAQFVQAASGQTKHFPEPSASGPLSPSVASVRVQSANTNSIQDKPERSSAARETAPSVPPGEPPAFLGQLVLREDNPFRGKFLKKFQDSQTSGRSQRQAARSAKSGQPSLFSLTARRDKVEKGLNGDELSILPVIAGSRHDLPGGFKVYGVIHTQDTSIALTNRGELKVGSVVDGDPITWITMNEVRFKSGRTLKVSAQ